MDVRSESRRMYRKAVRYAYVLNNGGNNYMDDVHQAFLYYFDKSGGENLFDKPQGYILRCVKFMNRWKHSNATHNKVFYHDEGLMYIKWGLDDYFLDFRTPLQEIESKEAIDRIYKKIRAYAPTYTTTTNNKVTVPRYVDPEILITFLNHLVRGYQTKEAAELMGISQQSGNYYKRKLKDIINSMTNPFVANPLPVKKKITRANYDTNKDKYSDYEFNYERDSDSNEHYTLMTHKERYEGLLITEKEKLYTE